MARLAPDQIDAWLVKNVIRNLYITCNSDNILFIRSGSAVGADDGSVVIEATADRSVDITASGAGGLDTGSEAASTWYFIYLIWNPTTETEAGLLSASATSPTLPSGYTKKRLVGAVYNDGSSNFRRFVQHGKYVTINAKSAFNNAIGTTSVALDASSIMPPISYKTLIEGKLRHGTVGDASLYAYTNGFSAGTLDTVVAFCDGSTSAGIYQQNSAFIHTDTSQQYRIRCSAADQYGTINHLGYELDL